MRLHRLRVQAFGPFAGTEEVDLDELSAPGLFLLHGPTGAGKTSVLDAVCFAVYGRVPGARADGAVRLRSDHAPAGLAPEVVCELSVAGRRFEVTRSPAWERPKKRGAGTTTEQARTLLRELVGGEWVARSSRNDEASQLLTDVLGMGLDQFTKVVLLPQGEFAAFLRAGAEARRPLLQRLFGTDRFAAVERWLVDERRRLTREVEAADAGVERLVARAHQAVTGVLVLDHQPVQDPTVHLEELRDAARSALAACRDEHAAASGERRHAVGARDALRRQVDRTARLVEATAEAARLAAEAGEAASAERELEAARCAEAVSGHLAAVDDARRQADQARRACTLAAEGLLEADDDSGIGIGSGSGGGSDTDGSDGDDDVLARSVRTLRDEVTRLQDLVSTEAELEAVVSSVAGHTRDAERLAEELALLDAEASRRGTEASELRAELQLLSAAAADVDAAGTAVLTAQDARAAAVRASRLSDQAGPAHATLSRAVDLAQQARDAWLDLRELRLAGMAAELAADLVDGGACPVCGAQDHPAPAPGADGGVTRAAEDAARVAVDAAETARADAEQALAALREELGRQTGLARGLTPEDAAAELAAAGRRLSAAEKARTRAEEVRARTAVLDAADVTDATRRAGLVTGLAAARAAAAEAARQAEQLTERVAAARGEDPSLVLRAERLAARADGLERLLEVRAADRHARAVLQRVRAAADEACREAGFATVTDASQAARTSAAVATLEQRVRTYRDRVAAVAARLAEQDLRAAAQDAAARTGTADPATHLADLTALCEDAETRLTAAEEHLDAAARALALAERAAGSLEDLLAHLAADEAAAAPLRAQHEVVTSLSRCVEGGGGDNALRMRLSAFVLAARLEQVAEAATQRLAVMSGGRYALVHSDAAERGGARSGLGLRVVDGWTGLERDTSSLSGGESFLASLSLALGLADVVQAEAGGAAIETLFVDEGFGTLDEETLEEVMVTLDGLREGGRAVGLVSHVAELRNRIPSRLEVVKTRTGSHLRTRADVA